MAYQSLNLGTEGDDGTGDSMRAGGDKINDNFSEIYTLLGTGTTLTTGMSATGSVVTLTAATVATSIAPSSSDGASLGTASLEWSDLYLADGGQILFGDDQDVTITHDADDGLVLKSTATADDNPFVLTIQTGETDIALNDVIGQIDFQAPDEGTGTDAVLVAAGIAAISEGDFSSSNNATKLSFKTAASEAASEKMSLSSAGLLTIADDLMIKDGGTIGVASTNDAITISSAGIVTLKDDLVIKDGGTIGVTSAATAMTIASTGIVTFVDDIVIKDGGTIGVTSAATAMTISSGGIVTFVDDILIKDGGTIGTATDADSITIAAAGAVTLSQRSVHSGGITIADAGQIGSASDADAIAIASNGVVTFTQAPVFPDGSINIADLDIDGGTDIGEDIVDADLFVIDNGAGGTNRKVAASRIKSYAGGGGWTLIHTVSGSDRSGTNNSELEIEPTFSTTYDIYQIRVQDIKLVDGESAKDLKMHLKFDGAYKTGTDYTYWYEKIDHAATRTVVDDNNQDDIALGQFKENLNGIITVYNPLKAVGYPVIHFDFVVTVSTSNQHSIVSGGAMYDGSLTSLSIQGIRFSTSGNGQLDDGTGIINVYGAPMA